jgi:hypothetical protein
MYPTQVRPYLVFIICGAVKSIFYLKDKVVTSSQGIWLRQKAYSPGKIVSIVNKAASL